VVGEGHVRLNPGARGRGQGRERKKFFASPSRLALLLKTFLLDSESRTREKELFFVLTLSQTVIYWRVHLGILDKEEEPRDTSSGRDTLNRLVSGLTIKAGMSLIVNEIQNGLPQCLPNLSRRLGVNKAMTFFKRICYSLNQ
jgi:hypothetical protein